MQQVMRILAACAPAVEVGKVPQGILRSFQLSADGLKAKSFVERF